MRRRYNREAILEYVKQYTLDNRRPPAVEDVRRGCKISSKSVAQYHLDQLAKAGRISKGEDTTRSIIVIEDKEEMITERDIERIKRENNLLRQLVKAYEDALENVGDSTAWIAVGSAKTALEHHDRNTEQINQLRLDGVENLTPYDTYSIHDGRLDSGEVEP